MAWQRRLAMQSSAVAQHQHNLIMATSARKHSGSSAGKKVPFKEKIIQLYDALMKGEQLDDSEEEVFWSEFFLLKPKITYLEQEVAKLSHDQLSSQSLISVNLNKLFQNSLVNLSSEHQIKAVYALQTLCGLLKAAFHKHASGFDLIRLLMSPENVDRQMQQLIAHLNRLMTGDEPESMKDLCLKFLVILCTGVDDISRNILVEHLMANSLFESLVHLVSYAESRDAYGPISILLLTLLLQFRKYDTANPYGVKLSILDQEISLHGFAQVITSSLSGYTKSYAASVDEQASSGWLSSITAAVGSMFVSGDEMSKQMCEQTRALNFVLLAFYEAVHRNRNFMTTLANYQTAPTSTTNVSAASASEVKLIAVGSQASLSSAVEGNGGVSKSASHNDLATQDALLTAVPSNLLVTFLEYCSIVMQDTKSDTSSSTVKLCFLILLCITEDHYANALMHDVNLVFAVRLHCMPMRHRKISPHWEASRTQSRPLASAVMDLMVEFVRSHMMKRFPEELYALSLAIIHRLLAYEKRARVRLAYPWNELWTALISLVKFITANESGLIKKMNLFSVALQALVIFNLFITYGDTFLPSPSSYDELYYELVRCHATFDALYSMALRYSTGCGQYKESAVRVTNSLVNIRAIIAHFCPKIDAWLSSQQVSTPTEEEILEVVKSNYDSLTLKLQDGLDQYERYAESPKHRDFFTGQVRSVVLDARHQVVLQDFELQTILHDFSTIQ